MNSPGGSLEIPAVFRDSEDDYNLPDDDGVEYRLPDEENEEERETDPKRDPWSLLFKIMISPVEGWKDLRRSGLTPDNVGFGLFLPLSILAALSDFITLIYDPHIGWINVIVNSLLTFISYFFGYFIAGFASKILLPKRMKEFLYTNFGKAFAMFSISTLALFHILLEILPIFEPIFYFLPLWTVYIIVKGMKFVKIQEDKSSYTLGVVCVTIVGAPIFVDWIFSLFSFQ